MTRLEEFKYKRNNSLTVVCTLGLAVIFVSSVRPVWMTNLFDGTSFDNGAIGFIMKLFSYIILAFFTSAIMFVIHLLKLIHYQIEISKLTP